jgi:hypothetical protein
MSSMCKVLSGAPLEQFGHDIIQVTAGTQACETADPLAPDLIALDARVSRRGRSGPAGAVKSQPHLVSIGRFLTRIWGISFAGSPPRPDSSKVRRLKRVSSSLEPVPPVFSWLVLSKTIVIWPSKIAQLEPRISGLSRPWSERREAISYSLSARSRAKARNLIPASRLACNLLG